MADVWQVEKSGDSEAYSNGLRIDNRFAVRNHARSYHLFPADPSGGVGGSQPMGIVFHTTESRQAPFEAQENRVLRRLGECLREYVQRKRAYNYLIDRFGRAYRIVVESDAADHAGYSVWSDGKWLYLNLNESFLGISFEAETEAGQVEAHVGPAQLRAAAMLTEMLRSRYGIAGTNCVAHAQVSVNPSNMRIGYHMDWASSFPFEALGLPDNKRNYQPRYWPPVSGPIPLFSAPPARAWAQPSSLRKTESPNHPKLPAWPSAYTASACESSTAPVSRRYVPTPKIPPSQP